MAHTRQITKASRWYYPHLNLLFFGCVGACSTTADFYRDDRIVVSGTILGSTNEEVVVDRAPNPPRSIARGSFTSIDHPGNVAAVAGLGLAGWALIGLKDPSVFGCTAEQSEFCVLLTLPALVVGVTTALCGSWVWGRSVARAQGE